MRTKRLATWAALAGLFGVIFEITCRVEDRVRFGTPWFTPITSQGDLVVFDKDGAHGRPNSRYQKWVMNSLGMRGPDAAVAKPESAIRVVTAGASETYGLYESPNREYPRQLEDSLNARAARGECARCARHYEVLNAAMAGMSLPTVTQDILTRVAPLRPDIVVVYPSPAQYLENDPPRAAPPDSTGTRSQLAHWRVFYPRAADRLRNQVKLMLPEPITVALRNKDIERMRKNRPSDWLYTSIPADRLSQFDSDLRTIVGAIRSIGATPVFGTHADAFAGGHRNVALESAWERFYPRATAATIIAFDSAARITTQRVAADSGFAVVDLMGMLAAQHGTLFQDYSHFTDTGSALVASALAEAILKSR